MGILMNTLPSAGKVYTEEQDEEGQGEIQVELPFRYLSETGALKQNR